MEKNRYKLQPQSPPKLLSIVMPCFNEEDVIPYLKSEMNTFLSSATYPVEVILVNDGSYDNTLDLLWKWASEDPRIKLISLGRNFGQQLALTAGLDHASGDAIVIMDADLQDPLTLIPAMVAKYEEGFDVVYGQREERDGETVLKKITAWVFYRLMKALVLPDLPLDTGDFRLISKKYLNILNSMRETHRFLRGMGAWIGFAQVAIKYHRPQRAAGETKYPFKKMVSYAWTAAISFSPLPLRLSLGLGVFVALCGFGFGLYAVLQAIKYYFFYNPAENYSPGWASLITLLCLIGGAILMSLGVLGEYIGRIFEEIKGRPLYTIREKKNI